MKKFLLNVSKLCEFIYGWVIYICLFVGGLTFFGYAAALIIGGDIAAQICDIIYNYIFKYLIYAGNIAVLIGLLNMYIKKQKSLSITNSKDMS